MGIGEWIIRKVPGVKSIYSAAKQISGAIGGSESTQSFREVVLIQHPRRGEYAFAFITGTTTLQTLEDGEIVLFVVFVPTNHIYVGDVFLLKEEDIIRTNLSVPEGIEVVVSVGMAVPSRLTMQ